MPQRPGQPRSKGRAGRPWLRIRASKVAEWRTHGRPCWLCGDYIDWTLPANNPWAGTADHVVPISMGGPPRDPDNLAPAHMLCNSRRGNGPAKPRPVQAAASRRW